MDELKTENINMKKEVDKLKIENINMKQDINDF